MITNERQYRITRAQAEKFEEAIDRFGASDLARRGIDPVIVDAQRASLVEQLADLKADLAHYETFRSGTTRRLAVTGIAELGASLIEARIVRGLSQRDLAKRLGMREQQIQRYEQERYVTANLIRCAEVAEALGVGFDAHLEVRQPQS